MKSDWTARRGQLYDLPQCLQWFVTKKKGENENLHNARHAAAGCKHLAPVLLLTPGDRPAAIGLAAASTSLQWRLLLLLLQRVRNERCVRGRSSGNLSGGGCRIGMGTRRRRRRQRGNISFLRQRPIREHGHFGTIVYAQMVV